MVGFAFNVVFFFLGCNSTMDLDTAKKYNFALNLTSAFAKVLILN